MGKKLARETAMCLFFEYAVLGEFSVETIDIMDDVLRKKELSGGNLEYIQKLIDCYTKHKEEIDQAIVSYLKGWNVSRLSKVDLSILRIAISEIEHFEDIPYKVSINEAVEMAKKYSTDKAPKFVNGVLGSYVRDKGL